MRRSGLADAVQQQDVQKAESLIYRGADVNERGSDGATALHWATWFRLDLVHLLLERDADPSAANVNGETPVHWAAKCSNITALRLFTAGKPELLSVFDQDGYSPFIMAAQWDNAPLLEWFYLRGVAVDEQDNMGRTALQWASYKGHKKAVQWLLSRQANVGHRDHEKMTALHWAALKGHENVLDHLVQVGAVRFLMVPDSVGDTALSLAWQKKHHYLAAVLLKAWIFSKIIGRPYIFKCQYAAYCVTAMLVNWLVYFFIFFPALWETDLELTMIWAAAGVGAILLWFLMKFSDPGFLSEATIQDQNDWIQLAVDNPAMDQMAHAMAQNEISGLPVAEAQQAKVQYQRQLIHEARRQREQRDGDDDRPDRFLQQASFALKPKLEEAMGPVAALRRKELEQEDKSDYLELIDEGKFKAVCVVCRCRRDMRSHHCNELARCIARMDHFCPWVDNGIGLNNQRQFLVFLVTLESSLLVYYGLAERLFSREWAGEQWASNLHEQTVATLCVLFVGVVNFLWTGFVAALILRHVLYMIANVTTFEVIVRPPHVVQRFPKKRSPWCCGVAEAWFLEGLTLYDAIMNMIAFWTLDESRDEVVFKYKKKFASAEYNEMDDKDDEEEAD